MLKSLSIFALVALSAVCAFATTTISGTFNWVAGTTTATVTPSKTPQSVTLKVGTTTQTITGVIVIGDPTMPIPSGSLFEVLKAGSQPFLANFTSTSVTVFNPFSGSGPTAQRIVPMSSTGILSNSIGFQDFGTTALSLFYPNFTVGTYTFFGGMSMEIDVALAKYSVTLPGPSVASGVSTLLYPTGSPAINYFDFVAQGEGSLEVGGRSTSNEVWVSGQFQGVTTTFTSTQFIISNAQSVF